jgi:hypothetical protein
MVDEGFGDGETVFVDGVAGDQAVLDGEMEPACPWSRR